MTALEHEPIDASKLGAGVYPGLPRAAYASIPAVSQSILKLMRRTPAHAKAAIDFPPEPTDAMRLGTLIHTALLEPKRFASRYVVMPDLTQGIVDKNGEPYKAPKLTNEYRARVKQFGAENVGKLFIEADEKATCDAIAESIAANETASGILSEPGESELAIVWEDKATGLLCKALIDRLADNWAQWIAADLKTTEDAGPGAFARDALKYGHHIQTAFYLTGLARVGQPAHRFLHIVCEKARPHAVAVYELDDESVDQGIRECEDYLRQYAECQASGHWPAYPTSIQTVRLPRYGFTDQGT